MRATPDFGKWPFSFFKSLRVRFLRQIKAAKIFTWTVDFSFWAGAGVERAEA
jgi:hypothetical protein